MRLAKLRHFLRYGMECSDGEWDTRQKVIATLRGNGYSITEAPNPCRLNAGKGEEEFIIDIMARGKVGILPVKWVYGSTNKPILVTDIPSSGRYGVWNEESKYYDEMRKLIKARGNE